MKPATLAVFALASLLAAQNVPGPKAELADVIAVEEQEGDLAKAEELYRQALAGNELTVPARALANLRLGMLLERLGRAAEAKPFLEIAAKSSHIVIEPMAPQGQDVERQKQLRLQAAALVKRVLGQRGQHWGPPLHGVTDSGVANQLLWLGEAAVPEVIAALQGQIGEASSARERLAVSGLAGFLWKTGGDAAAEFLSSCTKVADPYYREAIARTAFQAESERMLAVAAQFLRDPDESGTVFRTLLQSTSQQVPALQFRLDPDVVVDAALHGPPAALDYVFSWARQQRAISPPVLARLHARVRVLLSSTDPELGAAASRFLLTATSQQSVEGLAMLLAELPKMAGSNNIPHGYTSLRDRVPFTPEEARRLLPKLDACAKALGPADQSDATSNWLAQRMWQVATDHGPGCEAELLGWIDLGYRVWRVLAGRVTMANARDVVARVGKPVEEIGTALYVLRETAELPREVFPLLRDRAEAVRGQYEHMEHFAWPMARTRDPEAAAWIFAEWDRTSGNQTWPAGPLVELGRYARDEPVRNALRAVAVPMARSRVASPLLALLAIGDERALELVTRSYFSAASSPHPYAAAPADERPSLTPLQYLIYERADPPHPYGDAQVHAILRGITADGFAAALSAKRFSVGAIPDRHLIVLADRAIRTARPDAVSDGWVHHLMRRMRYDSVAAARRARLAEWCAGILRGAERAPRVRLLAEFVRDEDTGPLGAVIEGLVDSNDERTAELAVGLLCRVGVLRGEGALERLAGHRHAAVRTHALGIARPFGVAAERFVLPLLADESAENRRQAAEFAGEIVSKAAVPDLIERLRDPEAHVREAAAESLTRIRFYHEQQAHWDRILKGLDASPASAAEKLLLQAKPGQPRDQRLLAIKSLGVLGAPEALPFLIDWTRDGDREIGAEAGRAISRIHLAAEKNGKK